MYFVVVVVDNVHVQQSMQLANALVSGSIQFRMQVSAGFKFHFILAFLTSFKILSHQFYWVTQGEIRHLTSRVSVKNKSDWAC